MRSRAVRAGCGSEAAVNTDPLTGILVVAGFVLTLVLLPFGESPLGPWEKVGSRAEVLVVNTTDFGPLYVTAEAPEVDRVVRPLGFVEPHSEKVFKLPYADTPVTIRVEDRVVVTFNADRPKRWTVQVDK